ncbi:metallophosphoesterase [Kibdelosporangium lantanae]
MRKLSLAEDHERYVAKYSRRSLLRAGGAALAVGGLVLPGQAHAAPLPTKDKVAGSAVRPFGRHLAFGADASRQVVVSWQVPAAVTAPFVRIGLAPGDFGAPIAAEVRALTSQFSWQQPVKPEPHQPKTMTQYYLHARLDQLVPDTTYYYVVGHQGYDPAGDHTRVGDIASFRTAPTAGQGFTFTAYGDEGVGYHATTTANLIAGAGAAFHLHMGDLSYANSSGGGETSDSYDARVWDQFFVQNEPVAAQVPWMMAIGNHEMEPWYSADGYGGVRARFAMPDNAWAASTGIYSWRYQNVGLISLDGNDICYNTPANLNYTKGKQAAFLKSTLAAMRADTTIDFIVVYFHQCAYTTCPSNGAELGAQQDWAPSFDKYQVDLVLNGHNHVYERTDPIKAGKATRELASGDTVNPKKDGTVYVVAGGGGDDIYKFPSSVAETYLGHETKNTDPIPMKYSDPDGNDKTVKVTWSRVRYRGHSILVVDAIPGAPGKPARLDVRAVAEDGSVVDQFTVRRG